MSSHYAKPTTKTDQKQFTMESAAGSKSTDQITDTLIPCEDGSKHFNAMPLMIRGVLYQSHKEAAKALGVTPSAISQRLKRTGSADTVGLGLKGAQNGNKNRAKAITLFGVEFPSRTIAAEELGITRSQIYHWLSPKATNTQREMLMLSVMKYQNKRAKK